VLDERLKARLPRILVSVALLVLVLFLADMLARAAVEAALGRIAALAFLVLLGLAAYALAVLVTGAARAGDLRVLLRGWRAP